MTWRAVNPAVYGGVSGGMSRYPGGASYDAEAAAYFTAAGITNTADKTAINKFIVDRKAYLGITTLSQRFDGLVFTGVENSTAALVDVLGRITPTIVNNPTFTAHKGFKNSSLGQYIRCGFNPTVQASRFTLNSHTYFWWSSAMNHVNPSPQNFSGVNNEAGSRYTLWPEVGGNAYAFVNGNYVDTATSNAGDPMLGLWATARTASNAVRGIRDGVNVVTGSSTPTAFPNLEWSLLAEHYQNAGYGGATTTGNEISCFGFLDGMTAAEMTDLYNGLNTLASSLGWQ